MFNTGYPYQSGLQQMQNPYQARLNALQQSDFMQQRIEIVKVTGENGAKAFQLPPNSSILLLDEAQPILWVKATDGAGYPTITPYSISPYQVEAPVDTKSLEQRIERLEAVINGKSDSSSTKSKAGKSADADAAK